MLNPMLLCDAYKLSHRLMYPPGTSLVYSTWTARESRIPEIDATVVFGLQAFVKDILIEYFDDHFFQEDIEKITQHYKDIVGGLLGAEPDVSHIEALHRLRYLPLKICALPEGTVVPIRVPQITIENTHPEFFWLTNYIESLMSCELWQASTSATIARRYRKMLDAYAMQTVGNTDFVPYQGHDFSFRGMSSLSSSILSGMGHLTSFVGTDTIPAIIGLQKYYEAEGAIGSSVPATEHSVQCTYGNDLAYFRAMINDVHPSGMVSIVADGYDFWGVIQDVLPALKDDIMKRDGKVIIRPDSGNPVDIVCGNADADTSAERKGAVEMLWDIFGGTETEKGFRLLDPHIGLIYGDAITFDRARMICERLMQAGFASINCVFGVGSYTYQYNTRDTFGHALKTTLAIVNGEERQVFKSPKTDNGVKKSQKGRVAVFNDHRTGSYYHTDGHSLDDVIEDDKLEVVFDDGMLMRNHGLEEIRNRLRCRR